MTRAADLAKLIAGGGSITVADNSDTLTLESTDADANVGPILNLHRNSASPADNDSVGRIVFKADDDAGNESTFARIEVVATDVSNGGEDGRLDLVSVANDTAVTTLSALGGNVGIGTTSPTDTGSFGKALDVSSSTGAAVYVRDSGGSKTGHFGQFNEQTSIVSRQDDGNIAFYVGASPSEKMRVDSSGLLRIGNTSGTLFDSSSATGIVAGTSLQVATDGSTVGFFNRLSSDGSILILYKDGTAVGNIGSVNTSSASRIFLANSDTGLHFNGSTEQIIPCNGSGAKRDNGIALGNATGRFTQLFANSSSINTSDQNEKQDITSLTAKELSVAKKLSTLFKTYRWKDRVEEKGDKARTHTGIIAQDIQSEFNAEGLDASKYGLFCSDTWWEKDQKVYYTKEEAPKDAEEKTRLGVRYAELFSFIFSSIEARLTALESK